MKRETNSSCWSGIVILMFLEWKRSEILQEEPQNETATEWLDKPLQTPLVYWETYMYTHVGKT